VRGCRSLRSRVVGIFLARDELVPALAARRVPKAVGPSILSDVFGDLLPGDLLDVTIAVTLSELTHGSFEQLDLCWSSR